MTLLRTFGLLDTTPHPTIGWVLIAGFVVFLIGYGLIRTRQSRWFLFIYGGPVLMFASLAVHDGGIF